MIWGHPKVCFHCGPCLDLHRQHPFALSFSKTITCKLFRGLTLSLCQAIRWKVSIIMTVMQDKPNMDSPIHKGHWQSLKLHHIQRIIHTQTILHLWPFCWICALKYSYRTKSLLEFLINTTSLNCHPNTFQVSGSTLKLQYTKKCIHSRFEIKAIKFHSNLHPNCDKI